MPETITTNLSQIFLDPKNPRHDLIEAQRDLIIAMIEEQDKKLSNLAEDIIENGINPADLPIIIPSEDEKDSYIVVEGNRRITALKLLTNPELSKGTNLHKTFKSLSTTFKKKPITELRCVCYDTRGKARHWIDLKHTGENNGKGTVGWNPSAKRRFEAQIGKASFELQALDFLHSNLSMDEESEKKFKSIDTSTVNRLLSDPVVRNFLGLEMKHGVLYSQYSLEETARVLFDFLYPFAFKEKKVNDVYYKDDRASYIKDLPDTIKPNDEHKAHKNWDLGSQTKTKNKINKNTNKIEKVTKKSKPLSKNRNYLIKVPISIDHARINSIYRELRSLNVHDHTNAVAVLLRVFLETSLDNFIDKKEIEKGKNDSLSKKIERVTQYMETISLLTKHQLKPTRKAVSQPDALFSANTLNAYVHNLSIQPKGTELNATWDEMELFVEKLWE